jgi:hypothetical protein
MMEGYNWTPLDTPEAIARLKSLLDSGMEVFVNTERGFAGKPWKAMMYNAMWNIPGPRQAKYTLKGRLDAKYGELEELHEKLGISFLDPIPAPRLKWEDGSTHRFGYSYRLGNSDGRWYAMCDKPNEGYESLGTHKTEQEAKDACQRHWNGVWKEEMES